MYCTTSPGYPLTSSTVYSPPPRPLPRNTFSRPAFSLKKPYKHCNWKCAALSAILLSVTLLFLLAYFIGESPLNASARRVGAPLPTPAPPGPRLSLNRRHRIESALYYVPSLIRFNSVALCERSYIGTRRLTPRPHTSSEITLSFIDWVDWIQRDGLFGFLLL